MSLSRQVMIDVCGLGMTQRIDQLIEAISESDAYDAELESIDQYCYFTHYNLEALKNQSVAPVMLHDVEIRLFNILNAVQAVKSQCDSMSGDDVRNLFRSLLSDWVSVVSNCVECESAVSKAA